MCGRYTHKFTWKQLYRLYNVHDLTIEEYAELKASFNTAPSQKAPVVRLSSKGERAAELMTWGLVPNFSKDGKPGPCNARAETVATNGLFRGAFGRRRCIVPASGFYEWKQTPGGKVPHYIHTAEKGGILSFAGLWEFYRKDEQSEPVVSFTIITVPPNDMMATLHGRMPAILQPEDFDTWLDPKTPLDDARSLLRPAPDGTLAMHPVSRKVNTPKNDGPELIEPLSEPEPAPDTKPKPRPRPSEPDAPTLFG